MTIPIVEIAIEAVAAQSVLVISKNDSVFSDMASSNDKEWRMFKLDEVPKGSRLERYLKEIPEVTANKEKFFAFLRRVSEDCLNLFVLAADIPYLPPMKTILVPTHGEFKRLEEMESRHSYSREEAKRPELVRAFVVGNKYSKRTRDMEARII